MSRAAAVFPADPVLLQLPIALDCGHMRQVFGDHFAELGQREFHVEACRVDRIRYRRGERCVLQYELSLRSADTGLTQPRWVTGEMYAGERLQQRWRELRSRGPGVSGDRGGPPSTPGSLLPDLGMLVHLFPHDPRLPALERLTTAPPRELEAALLRDFGPGSWQAEGWTIETVRYRAKLGATLRYATRASESGSRRVSRRRFYVKVYPGGGAVAGHAVLVALWRRAAARDAEPGVARPIACLPELGAVVQEEVPGVSFEEILSHGRDPVSAARRIGRVLARFHLDDLGPAGLAARVRTRSDDVAIVHRAAQRLAWGDPGFQADLERLAGAVAGGLEEGPRRPTHGDLKIDHLLLHGDRVRVIDVDSFALGDPMTDLGSLLADMDRLRVRCPGSADSVRAAAGALVDEYVRRVPSQWRHRLSLCCAGALLDKAVYFFRRQEPDWRTHVRALIDDAGHALAGRHWW